MFLIEFWNSLILGQQIFLCIAVPATVLLVVLIVTMLFGMGDSDADADLDGDGDFDADDPASPGFGLDKFTQLPDKSCGFSPEKF